VNMGRHRFGEGEYRYFTEPFPAAVVALKQALCPRLPPTARNWWTKLGRNAPWPDDLADWLQMCHAAGQTKPTPILLKYGPADWNALHRVLYGEPVFPLQVVINLNHPGIDHTGGKFLLYEQHPRVQSRGTATLIPHGHGLVFTTRDRPVQSQRGWSAAPVRHGVSVIRSGRRFTLGLIFHDATGAPTRTTSARLQRLDRRGNLTDQRPAVHTARRRPARLPQSNPRPLRRSPQDQHLPATSPAGLRPPSGDPPT
jgi:hypothetical protein